MFSAPVIWVNGYTYLSELWDPKWRVVITAFAKAPTGQWILTLIAYLNRTWTGIHIWCGIATGI